jgi:hypothetical protein
MMKYIIADASHQCPSYKSNSSGSYDNQFSIDFSGHSDDLFSWVSKR